jgi:predicted SAM-dependent methyltransferase
LANLRPLAATQLRKTAVDRDSGNTAQGGRAGQYVWSMDSGKLKDTIRPVVARTLRPSAKRRTRLLVEGGVPHEGFKVEIGCGPSRRPGWIATDVTWDAPYYLDGTKPWPFPAGSVQYVYGDNVIEHLPLQANRTLIRHAHVAMRSGGTIRLVTPDVGRLVEAYLSGGPVVDDLLAMYRGAGYTATHPVDVLRVTFTEFGHHAGYLWDWEAAAAELADAGFRNVRRCETGASSDPVLIALENRSNSAEASVQLVIEATA